MRDQVEGAVNEATTSLIPDTAYVQVCSEIMPEGAENVLGIRTIPERFEALTRRLPLNGAGALRLICGELALTRYLRAHAPWCRKAIDLIDRQMQLQLWAGRPWVALPPMLLVGPPGAGKSHFARLMAKYAGCGHAVLDLGGISDNRTIEGTARGYTNAQPCFAALAIHQAESANPVLIVEEIDKAGGSAMNGNPLATLLTMIERGTAARYYDKCLMAEIDLSHVNWLFTANTLTALPAPLLSRVEVIEIAGPTDAHFPALLADVLEALSVRWGVLLDDMPDLHPEAADVMRQRFSRHRSARLLARDVEQALAAVVPLIGRTKQ